MIQVDGVSKRFPGVQVLNGAGLEVCDATVVAILGPSGIGKTVLLRIMAGLLAPDAGRMIYDGRPLGYGMFADNRDIIGGLGYVFQGGALFDSMTVAENIALPLREALRLSGKEVGGRVQEALETVGMQNNAGLRPRVLSGGMTRLVAIARAIVTNPRCVFFDEPTAGLDPAMRDRICGLIRSLRDRDRKTEVVVTHDIEAAREVADRLYMLRGGSLVPADRVKKEDYEQAYA
jgi:phospholipid/cholesterol/gamma-HCH transport system ATP-binding protein